MHRLLALDLSTKTGWAFFTSTSISDNKSLQPFKLEEYGLITLNQKILDFPGDYPENVKRACWAQTNGVVELIERLRPDTIVIEDTVPGRQALSQRFLEWYHYSLLSSIDSEFVPGAISRVVYIKTGVWRQTVGLKQSKQDAKNNKMANKIKELSPTMQREMRKSTGVKGKTTKKHLAVRMVNERFGLSFKVKDNDIADSILLGLAFIQGAPACDGT